MRARITICGLIIFPFHRLEHKFEILRVAMTFASISTPRPDLATVFVLFSSSKLGLQPHK